MVIVFVSLSMLLGLPYVLWVAWYSSVHHAPAPREQVRIFYSTTMLIGFAIERLRWRYRFKKGTDDDKS